MLIDEHYWIKKEGGEFLQEKYSEIIFNILPSSYNFNNPLLIPFQAIYNERMTRYYGLSLEEYVSLYVQQNYLYENNIWNNLAKAYLVEDFVRIFLFNYFAELLENRFLEYFIDPTERLPFNVNSNFTFCKTNRHFYGKKMRGDIVTAQFEFDYACRFKLPSKEAIFIAEVKTTSNNYRNGRKKLFEFLRELSQYVEVYYYLFRPPHKGRCVIPRRLGNNAHLSKNLHLSVVSIRFKKENKHISIEQLFKHASILIEKYLEPYKVKTKEGKLILSTNLLSKL